MQWGLTAENAEHIKQAKTAQVLKKSLHWKSLCIEQVTLNDSVNMSDISCMLPQFIAAEDSRHMKRVLPPPLCTHSTKGST